MGSVECQLGFGLGFREPILMSQPPRSTPNHFTNVVIGSKPAQSPVAAQIVDDYPLHEALNLLKGLHLLRKTGA